MDVARQELRLRILVGPLILSAARHKPEPRVRQEPQHAKRAEIGGAQGKREILRADLNPRIFQRQRRKTGGDDRGKGNGKAGGGKIIVRAPRQHGVDFSIRVFFCCLDRLGDGLVLGF